MNWMIDKDLVARSALVVLKLVATQPHYQTRGICHAVVDVIRDQYKTRPVYPGVDWEVDIFGMSGWEYIAFRQAVLDAVYAKISRWPEKSDMLAYPIKSPNPAWSPLTAFSHALDTGTLWDKSTEYGQRRWDLLDFLITEFTNHKPKGGEHDNETTN